MSCPDLAAPVLCGTGPNAQCTNTAIDPNNCGACGIVCALPKGGAIPVCVAGACLQ
jgi:hypothetical protein